MIYRSSLVNLRRLLVHHQKYDVQIRTHRDTKEEYAVWWPKDKPHILQPHRLWVLVPGGMSDGDSYSGYFDDLLASGAIDKAREDWCFFHNPGTGGAQWRTSAFCGLNDTSCLIDFLLHLEALHTEEECLFDCRYKEIVVMGFSVGGMLTLQVAHKLLSSAAEDKGKNVESENLDSPIQQHAVDEMTLRHRSTFRFVSVHSPDNLRLTFETMQQWIIFGRLDIPLALHFWAVNLRSGLLRKCPKAPQLPWPPTWSYIRKFTEAAWAQHEYDKQQLHGKSHEYPQATFEEFEHAFTLALRTPLPAGRVLRIQNPEDPVVPSSTLDPEGLKCTEVWWLVAGGHVMCFGACPGLGKRLRAWIEQPISAA